MSGVWRRAQIKLEEYFLIWGRFGGGFLRNKKVNRWGLSSHNIPTNWGKDNIVLIGDALHPMLPFCARANFALEDAFVLAKLIDLYTMEEVTDKYVQIRKPRLLRLMKQIKKNAWNFHLKRGFLGHARIVDWFC